MHRGEFERRNENGGVETLIEMGDTKWKRGEKEVEG